MDDDERPIPTYKVEAGWRGAFDVVRVGLVSNRVIASYLFGNVAHDVASFLNEAAEDEDL